MRHRLVVVALLLALPAACDDGPSASDETVAHASSSSVRPTDPPALTLPSTSAVPVVDPPVAPVGADEVDLALDTDCPQPWRPFFVEATQYGAVEPPPGPVEVAPVEGQRIEVPQSPYDADTDGDGAPDGVETIGQTLVISRGDGVLRLFRSGGHTSSSAVLGDLDADGRDDLQVGVYGTRTTSFVVPGSTPPGEHDPVAAGVRLPIEPYTVLRGVGDQDRDGADDVAVAGGVVSGRALLSPGPGQQLETFPSRLRTIPGFSWQVLALAPDVPPAFAAARATGLGGLRGAEVVVMTEPPVTLQIDRLPPTWGPWDASGQIGGFLSDDHRIVEYVIDGGRSGYTGTWMWDLDDPCRAPTPRG